MLPEPILEIRNLSKQFKNIKAVKNLSLSVYKNDVYGFLGPNGSGKSTSIRLMLALLFPDKGIINIFGLPLKQNRKKILKRVGAFIEKPDFYEYLSAHKNLEILAGYSRVKIDKKSIEEKLDLVGLKSRAHSKVDTFSKGMKQRLGIAQALLHDPEILILDEPASGLDPSGNRDIRELIRFLNKEKSKTIILSSHNLSEIELIANRMIIIKEGEKMVEGNVGELLNMHDYLTYFKVQESTNAIQLIKNSNLEVKSLSQTEQGIQIICKRQIIPEINSLLVSNQMQVESIRVEQSLEDYFLTLT